MIVGVVATVAVLFIFSVLKLFLSRFIHRPFHQVIPSLRQDDAVGLAELLDQKEDVHLRQALSRGHFRREQMFRIRLAHERIACRAHNVTVFQEWADTELSKARLTENQEIRTAADRLVVACAEFRMAASAVQTQLNLWQARLFFLPYTTVPRLSRLRRADDIDLLLSYDLIKETALKLARLCGGDCYERLLQAL